MKWLSGKKTYLGTIAMGVIGLLYSMDHLDERVAGILASIVGTWTGVAVRSAIGKAERAKP